LLEREKTIIWEKAQENTLFSNTSEEIPGLSE
jgi:hypothetical protein